PPTEIYTLSLHDALPILEGHRGIPGHLVDLERVDVHDRQVRAVDHALLRGRDDLGPGHGHRVRAEAVHGVGEDLALLHAQLEALEVVGLRDGPLVVPEVTEAIVEEEEDLEPVLPLELLVEAPSNLAVEH